MNHTDLPAQVSRRIFAEPQEETLLCVAGEQQLVQYLEKGKQKKSFAVLSDRCLYLFGRRYRIRGSRVRKYKRNPQLDLFALKRVSVVTRRSAWLLALCFFFLMLAPVMVLLDLIADIGKYTVLTPLLDAVVSLLLAAVCWLLYSCSKQRLLTVTGGEGVFAIDSLDVPEQEEANLIRTLRSIIARNREQ